jgi:hypothetical protein
MGKYIFLQSHQFTKMCQPFSDNGAAIVLYCCGYLMCIVVFQSSRSCTVFVLICTVVVLYCFVMCVCVRVCVGFVMCVFVSVL